jgi:uncharacterized protein
MRSCYHFQREDARYSLFRSIGRFFICAILFCAVSACGHLKERNGGPVETASHPSLLLEIYRGPLNHLSAVRRGDCPMYPSCSEFGVRAIATHGAIVGWMMTVDRLLRCGRDEMRSAPRVFSDGHFKAYDPVENNDFWWAPSPKAPPFSTSAFRYNFPE